MSAPTRNPEVERLIEEIEQYRTKHGVSKTAFGSWAVKDPNLLRNIEQGREPRWQTIKAIRDKMAEGAQ